MDNMTDAETKQCKCLKNHVDSICSGDCSLGDLKGLSMQIMSAASDLHLPDVLLSMANCDDVKEVVTVATQGTMISS